MTNTEPLEVADILVAHQRHANIHPPAGYLVVGCRSGWSQAYRERGTGYRRWAEHVQQVFDKLLEKLTDPGWPEAREHWGVDPCSKCGHPAHTEQVCDRNLCLCSPNVPSIGSRDMGGDLR